MAEAAAETVEHNRITTMKKRWRAWLRAIHRDVGYLAVGFTVIYALSGIAMNHLEDWDPNFHSSEQTLQIAPVPDDATDDEAVALVTKAAGVGKPDEVFRAGDEIRLGYSNGSQVTAIGDTVTVQARSDRLFFRVANWLHATRGKQAWKYISDAYAVLLLYLAISGLFMIKGKLGLRWRGMILMSIGLGVPLAYIVLSGGPGANYVDDKVAKQTDGSGMRLLTPEENVEPDPSPPPRPPVRTGP
jgi:hypothetical protein